MRAFVLSAGLLLCACRPARPVVEEPPPQVTFERVRLRSFRGEQTVAQGTADRLTFQPGTSLLSAERARVVLPPQSGPQPADDRGLQAQPTAAAAAPVAVELEAARATGHLASRQAQGSGGVQWRQQGGASGRTQSASIDGQARVVTGDQPVEVSGDGYRLSAGGFRLDLDAEHFTFASDVKSTVGGAP